MNNTNGNEYYKKIETISGQLSNINMSNGVAVSLITHSLTAFSAVLNNLRDTIGIITNLTSTDTSITNLTNTNGDITNLTSTDAIITNLTTTDSIICNGGITFPSEAGNATIDYTTNDLKIKSNNETGNISLDTVDVTGALTVNSSGVTSCVYPEFDPITVFVADLFNYEVYFTDEMSVLFVYTDVSSVVVFLTQVTSLNANRICVIKRIGSNDVYINCGVTGTAIDDSSSNVTLSSNYSFIRLVGYVGNGTWYTC